MMPKFALIAALLLIATPASSDWQFTKWEKWPAQVVQGSENVAVETPPRQSGALTDKLSMPDASGELQFTVHFLFDQDDKLAEVSLDLKSGTSAQLRVALMGKYGQPVADGATWFTDRDRIDTIAGILLFYRPRVNANNSGL
mgnify:CR=1 FL=1